jgi:hypothetical protein
MVAATVAWWHSGMVDLADGEATGHWKHIYALSTLL